MIDDCYLNNFVNNQVYFTWQPSLSMSRIAKAWKFKKDKPFKVNIAKRQILSVFYLMELKHQKARSFLILEYLMGLKHQRKVILNFGIWWHHMKTKNCLWIPCEQGPLGCRLSYCLRVWCDQEPLGHRVLIFAKVPSEQRPHLVVGCRLILIIILVWVPCVQEPLGCLLIIV